MLLSDLVGKRVVVWGSGVEGRAAAEMISAHVKSASVTFIVDSTTGSGRSTVDGIPVFSADSAAGCAALEAAEVMVKSPGVSPYHGGIHSVCLARPELRVTGGSAIWFAEAAVAASRPLDRTIAVTGSKGKSTTASLIAHLLSELVDDVVLAGNVGRAPLAVLAAGLEVGKPFPPNRWYVLELSSFQTAELAHSPQVGVLTSLFPEHLDWHESVDRYYADKLNLFAHQSSFAVVNADNATVAEAVRTGEIVSGHIVEFGVEESIRLDEDGNIIHGSSGVKLVPSDAIPLTGRHNAMNVCGALTALKCAGFDPIQYRGKMLSALSTFRPLAYRLEPIGDLRGRLVIDDGLSTAPQAAIAALAAFPDRPLGIIIGGHDRGLDYDALADALSGRIVPTWVATVPESGSRIGQLISRACQAAGNTHVAVVPFDEFDDSVRFLDRIVPLGGVIMLSPAAPSFGRFRDYKERSVHFRRLLGL
jgi:UDP-N-acetylmuramoyl-L-alanine---L-glutamate ligase